MTGYRSQISSSPGQFSASMSDFPLDRSTLPLDNTRHGYAGRNMFLLLSKVS